MNHLLERKYISYIVTLLAGVCVLFLFAPRVSAQMTYGGKQLMYWGSEVCNSSNTNVHFILQGNGTLLTLYASPGIRLYGSSNVEFGVSQVGQYTLVPSTCSMNTGTSPVVIWVTDGTYQDASTGYSIIDQGIFLAGSVRPFVQSLQLHA